MHFSLCLAPTLSLLLHCNKFVLINSVNFFTAPEKATYDHVAHLWQNWLPPTAITTLQRGERVNGSSSASASSEVESHFNRAKNSYSEQIESWNRNREESRPIPKPYLECHAALTKKTKTCQCCSTHSSNSKKKQDSNACLSWIV